MGGVVSRRLAGGISRLGKNRTKQEKSYGQHWNHVKKQYLSPQETGGRRLPLHEHEKVQGTDI